MPLYQIEVQVCATAYIKAKNAVEAREIADGLKDRSPGILDSGGDVEVSGRSFSDPALPKVSLSPAMTIHGPWPGAKIERSE